MPAKKTPKSDSRTPKTSFFGKAGQKIGEKIGKASNWLPGVAAFLCLCLFAIALVALVDLNTVPNTGQKANAAGLSAQGVAGLKRLLEAKGHEVVLNRLEDGPVVEAGDLEIITLDDDGATQTYAYHFDKGDEDESSAAASASSSSTAEADQSAMVDAASSDEATSDEAASAAGASLAAQYGATQIPDPKRSKHILTHPLGKVVLIVAPKWNAGPDPRNRFWDRGPSLVEAANVRESLGFLSPMSETPAPEDEKAAAAKIANSPHGTRTVQDGDSLVTFDLIPYTIHRDTHTVIDQPAPSGDSHKDDIAKALNTLTPHQAPTKHRWTFRPVAGMNAGEGGFLAPLPVGVIDGLQTITGPNLQPLLVGPNGEAVLSRVIVTADRAQPKAPVYLLSDPDLLNNQILADPQKVASALTLVDTLSPHTKKPGRVIFNLTFNGISLDHDLVHAISRPPFIAVPLCLLIAGLGLMWASFSRFGPVLEAPAGAALGRGVRSLADNAARLLAVTLREVKLGPAYADLIRDQVLKDKGYRAGLSPESPDDLAERLGKAQKTTDSFIDLKARSGKVMTVHQLIDITLRLHAWKTEIQRAHI